jgi:hypothetical protein
MHGQKTKLVTKHSHSHILCSGHTVHSDMYIYTNASRPGLLPEGSSIDSFNLGLLPKLDFNVFIKSHNKTLRELANIFVSAYTPY